MAPLLALARPVPGQGHLLAMERALRQVPAWSRPEAHPAQAGATLREPLAPALQLLVRALWKLPLALGSAGALPQPVPGAREWRGQGAVVLRQGAVAKQRAEQGAALGERLAPGAP